jgi:hypothetical protein
MAKAKSQPEAVEHKPFTMDIDEDALITLSEMFMENQFEMQTNAVLAMKFMLPLLEAGILAKWPLLESFVKEYHSALNENKVLFMGAANLGL